MPTAFILNRRDHRADPQPDRRAHDPTSTWRPLAGWGLSMPPRPARSAHPAAHPSRRGLTPTIAPTARLPRSPGPAVQFAAPLPALTGLPRRRVGPAIWGSALDMILTGDEANNAYIALAASAAAESPDTISAASRRVARLPVSGCYRSPLTRAALTGCVVDTRAPPSRGTPGLPRTAAPHPTRRRSDRSTTPGGLARALVSDPIARTAMATSTQNTRRAWLRRPWFPCDRWSSFPAPRWL